MLFPTKTYEEYWKLSLHVFQVEEAFSKYQQFLKYCESFANKAVCTETWKNAYLLA